MTDYNKGVPFPEPYIPGTKDPQIKDPFGNTMRGTAPSMPLSSGGGGGGGPGGGLPDVDVRNGVTGAVMVAGTETLTINGRNIYWVQIPVNNNGTGSLMLFFSSLPY